MVERVYFLGIGGTLVGSLAILADQLGFRVSGHDDAIYPPMSEQLSSAGISAFLGFEPSHLEPNPDVVVVGNAKQKRGVEAVEVVLERKLNYVSAAEWLAEYILRGREVIAVAGTHGKTTTTSIIAWLLHDANLEPGFLVGGVPSNFGTSARIGTGRQFVVEADEYDSSYFDRRAKFLHYRPDVLLINNIEYDHADIYEDLSAIEYQFHHLIRAVPRNGRLIVPGADPIVNNLLKQGCWSPVSKILLDSERTSDSSSSAAEQSEVDTWVARLKKKDGTRFDVIRNERYLGTVSWSMLGEHNVRNAMFALATVSERGLDPEIAMSSLTRFDGVARRMQRIAKCENIQVYDDFAHHPTAIRETLSGLRRHVDDERILAVIEPRTHTMSLGALKKDLLDCCVDADAVWWFKGENIAWDMNYLLKSEATPTRIFDNLDHLVDEICRFGERPTHVVLMSNGSFSGIYDKIKARLA